MIGSSFKSTPIAIDNEIAETAYDDIEVVADNIDKVLQISTAITQGTFANIGSVTEEPLKSNINTVGGMGPQISQVASIETDISTVAGLSTTLQDVTSDPLRQSILDSEDNANQAISARDAILNMTVATGLPGSAANWNPTTQVLTVPKGDAGPQGIQGLAGNGTGDMTRAVYDTTNTGTVDNSESLGGNTSGYHLDRTNHTGEQAISTITSLDAELASKSSTSHNHDGTYLTPTGDGSGLTGIDSLPSQALHIGKYLTTNGTVASWSFIDSYTKAAMDLMLADKASSTHTHTGVYEPIDSTILRDSNIGTSVLSPTGDGSQLTGIASGGSYATKLKFEL